MDVNLCIHLVFVPLTQYISHKMEGEKIKPILFIHYSSSKHPDSASQTRKTLRVYRIYIECYIKFFFFKRNKKFSASCISFSSRIQEQLFTCAKNHQSLYVFHASLHGEILNEIRKVRENRQEGNFIQVKCTYLRFLFGSLDFLFENFGQKVLELVVLTQGSRECSVQSFFLL